MSYQKESPEWSKIIVLIILFSLFLAVVDFLFQIAGGLTVALLFDSVPATILMRFLVAFLTMLIVIMVIERKGFMQ